ncbi:hypothetical protein [Aquamicrobium ahrensii]|uniref:Uncharacterized protein (DUF2336 family) n=1 Tax=Aquamicrobium ahrensii TaxID=469551 RepID=A0ABV2KNH9_9HYPH
MSSSDFRQIAIRTEAGKAERLFRAAISAFCALTRPSRREITQLDDLTLPLFDEVSPEARRFAAAALSECESAPAGLVKRLSDEPVEISAPLLVRSRALADVELIALIGRHGLPHARAIARRKELHPTIASLVRALDRPGTSSEQKASATQGKAADRTRDQLRSMMADGPHPSFSVTPATPHGFGRLLDAALDANAAFFHTALADALAIEFDAARKIASSSDHLSLLTALRALELREAEAFLITSAALPGSFPDTGSVRLFIERYRGLEPKNAIARVASWAKGGDISPAGGRTLKAG